MSDNSCGLCGLKDYILNANEIPPYGYEVNIVEGVGTLLLMGAQISISLLQMESSSCLQKVWAVFLMIITSPFTLAGLAIKALGGCLPHPLAESDDAELVPESTPDYQRQMDEIYQIMQEFHAVAQEVGLPYIIMDGTLLGFGRHGGIIPWDDDADMGYLIKDLTDEMIATITQRLGEKGILFERQPESLCGYMLKYAGPQAKGTVDLFALNVSEDGQRVVFESAFFRAKFRNDWFSKEEILTADGQLKTEQYDFGPADKGLKVMGPPKAIVNTYLQRYYGPDCLKYGISTHGHCVVPLPCSERTIRVPFVRLTGKLCQIKSDCAQGAKWQGPSLLKLRRDAEAQAAAS